ncbi:uncharacterized protein ACMZJ9_020649, partial [Mantella aurantiaca]
ENKVREVEEERRRQWERKRLQKRHSMATCASSEALQAVDDLELTLERNLENLSRTSSVRLSRTSCVRLSRIRSFGSSTPNPFVCGSEQRERIQAYHDQRNAEEMREMSERLLRQQMEYKNSKALSPRHETLSPGFEALSPRHEAMSPGQEALSPRHETLSPGFEALSPRYESLSPRHQALSPRHESLSPRHEALSPGYEVLSPGYEALSPGYETLSPGYEALSPRYKTLSPGDEAFSPRHEAFSPRHEAFSPRHEAFSPRHEAFSPRHEAPNPELKASVYPVTTIPLDPYCQSAAKSDVRKSPPRGWSETSLLSPDIEEFESNDGTLTQPIHGMSQWRLQHGGHHKDPTLSGEPSALRRPTGCVTTAERDTQTEVIEQPGLSPHPLDLAELDISEQSKPFMEAAKPRPPSYQPITHKGNNPWGGTNRHPTHGLSQQSLCQSEASYLTASSQSLTHPEMEMPFMSGLKATCKGPLSQCKCVVITEKTSAWLENANGFSVKNELEAQNQQPYPQLRIPESPSGLETFGTTPESLMVTQFSITSSEWSRKSVITSNARGVKTWDKRRDDSMSQIPKQPPDKHKEANKSETLDQPTEDLLDLLETPCHWSPSNLSELHIRSDIQEQSLTSNVLMTREESPDLEDSISSAVHPERGTLSWPVQQGPSASLMTLINQNKPGNVWQTFPPNVSPSETSAPDKSETLPHTQVHLHPEKLRGDESPRQSALKIPKHYTVKSFKQTLVKSTPKNTRQSVASPVPLTSSPQLGSTRSDTSNPNQTQPKAELSRISQSKPECFMSRIKHVEHLSIKQPAKDMNDHVPPPPHNVAKPQSEVSRVPHPQDMEVNYYSKGLKDAHAAIQREAPNPCSKWKRELRKASENVDSCRVEAKVEAGNMEPEKAEQKAVDNAKHSSLGRTGSNISKKSKNDLGIRKVIMNKDITLGSTNSLVTKQHGSNMPINTETRDSKIPQKISAGSAKPTSSRMMGGFREKREGTRPNNGDSGKSERKHSPMLTSRHPTVPTESPGHGMEHVKEPVWPSKKANSVARVAIHVIKHCEVNSTLTRGSRSPYLTTQPVWR